MQETKKSALSIKDLTVELDNHTILDHVNLDVPIGNTTAIIGPNGAGKSILLKAILRLIPKKSGIIKIYGTDHTKYRKVAPLISYIPQRIAIDRNFPLTTEGLFELKSPRPLGMHPTERARMHELLTTVGIPHLLKQRLSVLSGGQLQRVMLAYSLMDHPKLLLMDEPYAGIDVQGQETIYALLARIREEEHITMIMVSHELEIVMQYANQVLCLNKKILCSGVPREVLTTELLHQMYGSPISHFEHTTHTHAS